MQGYNAQDEAREITDTIINTVSDLQYTVDAVEQVNEQIDGLFHWHDELNKSFSKLKSKFN